MDSAIAAVSRAVRARPPPLPPPGAPSPARVPKSVPPDPLSVPPVTSARLSLAHALPRAPARRRAVGVPPA
ncbi:hypothetical protein [Streptomyces sp. NPDC005805]|uniref:hypothetical protein n=1 Tax=Streptomyces sp. NPDC005805 TaxID=3157068 RepID=UPI0033FA9912